MNLLPYFYAFVTGLSTSLVMVPFLRRWALDRGAVDTPDDRKVHKTPTPRLGGIAIFLSFLFASLLFAPNHDLLHGILAGGLVVFVTGIADDLNGLTSRQKFLGQIIACLVTIFAGNIWLRHLGDPLAIGPITLPIWAGVPFTVFAVVGVTNAINLIDGLDGLAGGLSVLALAAFGLLGLIDGNLLTPLLAAGLIGAILGFLKYNFYPARIFMGDTGSLTVGFILGFLAVELTQRPGGHVNVLAPVVVLGLPIFDALWVMSRRLSKKTSPFVADKGHVHHKFLDLGMEHRFTVLVIYSVSLFWACSALLMRNFPEYVLLGFLPVTAVCFYLLLRHLVLNKSRYPFLARDHSGPIRNSVTFNRCADLLDKLLPLIWVVLTLYAVLGIVSGIGSVQKNLPALLLLLAFGVILQLKRRDGAEFHLLLTYAVACLLTFTVWARQDEFLFGLSYKRYGDALLLVSTILVLLKVLFRRAGEFFLGSVDFLALVVLVFLAIVAHQSKLFGFNFAGPLVRAILLILAVRTLAARGPAFRRRLIIGSLGVLALIIMLGLG